MVELLDKPLDDELELDGYLGRLEWVDGRLLCGTVVVTKYLRFFKADLIVAVKALCWALVKGGSVVVERHLS